MAANAEIGVARAAYFPNISLTGSGGVREHGSECALPWHERDLERGSGGDQPMFTAGRNAIAGGRRRTRRKKRSSCTNRRSGMLFTRYRTRSWGTGKLREFREQEALLLTSARDARRLAEVRYQGGATSYLEVLDADTRQFEAELELGAREL